MNEPTLIIGFDQHAASVVAAVLLPGQRTPVLHELSPDLPTIARFVDRVGRGAPVRCCYEAGPCGFELQRFLQARQVACAVIAPALIPRRAGDRIKADRRDASQLAVLYRAGALTAIHIPTEQEEAARDLLRCREDIRADLLRAAPSPLEVCAAARASIHPHEKGVVEAARQLAARRDLAAAGAGPRIAQHMVGNLASLGDPLRLVERPMDAETDHAASTKNLGLTSTPTSKTL